MDRKNIKAVLFDLDGTLIDSYDVYFESWKNMLKHHNITLTKEEFYALGGISYQEMLKILLKEKYSLLEKQNKIEYILKSLLDECNKLLPVMSKPQPFARETLLLLKNKGLKIAIVSATPESIVIFGIKLLDAKNIIDFYISNEDVKNHKPLPDCYLSAKEKYGLDSDECIVVEDSPVGITAGKNAEMKVIAVNGYFDKQEIKNANPDYMFSNLKQAGEKIISLSEEYGN